MGKGEIQDSILFMSSFPPRECGIATFTKDLTEAIDDSLQKNVRTRILALNKNGSNIYNYPKKVEFDISDNDINDYIETAIKINNSNKIKVVSIQHEFGLFGGNWGDHLLAFLEALEKPSFITFHSVIPDPDKKLKRVVEGISKKASGIVVMTPVAVDILNENYEISCPVYVIPHGIPDVSFESQHNYKERLNLQGKIVLSSFGLISSGKGYEYVIESLPKVIEKYPNLLYLIVGETHPVVRKNEGEAYRNSLEKKIKALGLQKHVKFYNKYVTLKEIISYIKASDIYISSALPLNQITSGTLSYAMGCGRSVISTPFLHAKDALDHSRGRLVELKNPESFTKQILDLLDNKKALRDCERNCYHYTRSMTWHNVATSYLKLFKKHLAFPNPDIEKFPEINTNHISNLTDDFGIIQFANQTTPEKDFGYTLDDNARALVAATMHYEKFKEFPKLELAKTYLNFLEYVQDSEGKLYNYVDINKKIDYNNWSKDAHGRAIWSLGLLTASKYLPEDFKKKAETILMKSLSPIIEIESPRALAFTIKGLYFYNKSKKSQFIKKNISALSDKLLNLYGSQSHKDWNWFEPYLTYSNSKLSEALLYAYLTTKDPRYKKIALESLDFLISKTFKNGIFIPVGQREWYKKNGKRSIYDQQPIEAGYMVQTLILAYKITREEEYRSKAIDVFKWFLGKNTKRQVVYNRRTGGCHDGLGEGTININQGAESTLSYLIARLSLTEL